MLYASELRRFSVARSRGRGQAVFLGRSLHQKRTPRALGVVRLWLRLTDVDTERAARTAYRPIGVLIHPHPAHRREGAPIFSDLGDESASVLLLGTGNAV